MTELICINCPRGCHLNVDEENGFAVTGNTCPRGAEYGKNEIKDPRRVLTSTVRITGAAYRRCPVRTNKAIPKGMLFEAMNELNKINAVSPVKRGDVLVQDFLNTGSDVIVTKDM